jgi:hypothetical protein
MLLNQFTDWTDAEVEILKANSKLPKKQLGKMLSRTPFAIQIKMSKLGLNNSNFIKPIPSVIKDEFYAFLSLGVSIVDACKAGGLDYASMRSDVSRRKRRGGVNRKPGRKPKNICAETGVSNDTASGVLPRNSRAREEGCGLRVAGRKKASRVSPDRPNREDGQRAHDQPGTG